MVGAVSTAASLFGYEFHSEEEIATPACGGFAMTPKKEGIATPPGPDLPSPSINGKLDIIILNV